MIIYMANQCEFGVQKGRGIEEKPEVMCTSGEYCPFICLTTGRARRVVGFCICLMMMCIFDKQKLCIQHERMKKTQKYCACTKSVVPKHGSDICVIHSGRWSPWRVHMALPHRAFIDKIFFC